MQTETINPAQQDEQAVDAVRRGDAERYRELVERHERRVYAVAWSRLGDASLAEEAAQEAFIRGYRRLWLLGDGTKFAAWISSIARHAAINLGLRHRRELNKRERWALEETGSSTTDSATGEREEICTPATLRQTLAELPAAHRECLVLFYLEAKSGAEAAVTLGISEAAFRVRLHRARAALRERLEARLAESLVRLRPAKALVPGVMAAVMASSSAKAAAIGGTGATLAGMLAKFIPLKWVFPFASLVSLLPMVLFGWLVAWLELKNFRDAKGFRARLFREGISRQIVWFAALMMGAGLMIRLLQSAGEPRTFYLVLGGLSLVLDMVSGRRLTIVRNRYFITILALAAAYTVVFLGIGLNWLPTSMIFLVCLVQGLAMIRVFGERPIRMDYNLFLRATQGMLESGCPEPAPADRNRRLSKTELLAFARFLGNRWLAINYRWTETGLRLRMPPANLSLGGLMPSFGSWSQCSCLVLGWDGRCFAELGNKDRRTLLKLQERELPLPSELENRVALAVAWAWDRFRGDSLAAAGRAVGETPNAEVFVHPPAATISPRFQRAILIGTILFVLAAFLVAVLL